MSDKEKQEMQQCILKINQDFNVLKKDIQHLMDMAWDKDAKKESSSMYKVLEGEKDYTEVRTSVGKVKVDKDFVAQKKPKHFDDPKLRGMITTSEVVSFPKVAKNVEPEYNKDRNDYTWKALANDESVLAYGSRKYEKDGEEVHRLLTTHSKTARGEREEQRQADRVSSATYFYNPDSRGSTPNEIIPQNPNESQGVNSKDEKIKALRNEVKKISDKNKGKDLDDKGLDR